MKISVGAGVLGAIFGRRSMGSVTTAARGAGRVAREREDVRRAEENVRAAGYEFHSLLTKEDMGI